MPGAVSRLELTLLSPSPVIRSRYGSSDSS